jgi:hypothetical protein
VRRRELTRMVQSGGCDQFGKRFDGGPMEIVYPL